MLCRIIIKNLCGNNSVAFYFNIFISAGFKDHCKIYNAAHTVGIIGSGVVGGIRRSGPYVCVCNLNIGTCGAGYFLGKVNNVHCKGRNAHCSYHHNRKHKSKSFFHVFFSSVLFSGIFFTQKAMRALRTLSVEAILTLCDKFKKQFFCKTVVFPI